MSLSSFIGHQAVNGGYRFSCCAPMHTFFFFTRKGRRSLQFCFGGLQRGMDASGLDDTNHARSSMSILANVLFQPKKYGGYQRYGGITKHEFSYHNHEYILLGAIYNTSTYPSLFFSRKQADPAIIHICSAHAIVTHRQ